MATYAADGRVMAMTGLVRKWGKRKDSPFFIDYGPEYCHPWIGCIDSDGYPQAWDGERVRTVYAIRYEREIGPIPDGMVLDHYVCDAGHLGCCNPHHCRPVTQRENVLRGNGVAARNRAKTHCIRGHPLSGDNLILKNGYRYCRACRKVRYHERRRGDR